MATTIKSERVRRTRAGGCQKTIELADGRTITVLGHGHTITIDVDGERHWEGDWRDAPDAYDAL